LTKEAEVGVLAIVTSRASSTSERGRDVAVAVLAVECPREPKRSFVAGMRLVFCRLGCRGDFVGEQNRKQFCEESLTKEAKVGVLAMATSRVSAPSERG